MHSLRERTLTAALWFFLPAMLVLAIVGGVRGFTAVPFWDMWHGYLDFYFRVRDGQWSAWWALHNEHRILLARLLFWVDLSWFHGTVWFLIAMNYLLVLASCLTFRALMRDRAPPWVGSKPALLVALLVYGWLFSWVQKENLTWGFQSQFFLAQWLPLLALYHLHRATEPDKAAHRHFVLACALGALSAVTMANGVLALPIMCAYAGVLRMGYRRLAMLLALCVACLWAYFTDYRPHDVRASPLATALQQPVQLLQYVLLYLGSPFHHMLKLRTLTGGQLLGLLLVVLAAAKAVQVLKQPRQHALEIALLAYLAYIAATALATGGGRLAMEGVQQATTSRYTTPALLAWAALLVLYLPWVLQHLAAWRHRVVWPMLLLVVAMLPVQWKATRSVRPVLFEQEVGALALALGVADEAQVKTMFYDPVEGVRLARRAQAEHLSVFGQPPLQGVRAAIGQRRDIPAGSICSARLTSVSTVTSSTAYVRVRGWLTEPASDLHGTAAAELLGRDGRVVGFVLTSPRPRNAPADIDRRALAFAGYLRSSEDARMLRLLSVGGACNTPLIAPPFRVTPDLAELARSGADVASIVVNDGWTGGDFGRAAPSGAEVFGSYVQSDADLGSLTLRLRRGSAIAYRSGPTGGHQRFSVDDGTTHAGSLPAAPDWTVLVFDSPDLPEHFTLTLSDQGAGWGEWSAVALREPGN